jgi:hypothetical protein
MLRCVRKEGKMFFAFGSKNASFIHSKLNQCKYKCCSHRSTSYIDGKVKNILQGMDKVYRVKSNSQVTIFFTKVITRILSLFHSYLFKLHHCLLSFGFALFSFVNLLLSFVILYIFKYCKNYSSLKGKVSTRYDFVTGLR